MSENSLHIENSQLCSSIAKNSITGGFVLSPSKEANKNLILEQVILKPIPECNIEEVECQIFQNSPTSNTHKQILSVPHQNHSFVEFNLESVNTHTPMNNLPELLISNGEVETEISHNFQTSEMHQNLCSVENVNQSSVEHTLASQNMQIPMQILSEHINSNNIILEYIILDTMSANSDNNPPDCTEAPIVLTEGSFNEQIVTPDATLPISVDIDVFDIDNIVFGNGIIESNGTASFDNDVNLCSTKNLVEVTAKSESFLKY